MEERARGGGEPENKKGFSGLQVIGLVGVAMVITLIATVLVVRYYFFPSSFTPVHLNAKEEQRLEEKLERFGALGTTEKETGRLSFDRGRTPGKEEFGGDGHLKPQAYSEKGASRMIRFTEREVNSLMAKNTDLAERLAIDLSKDLISFKLLVPVDPDFPVLGGKTLRARGGAELAFRQGKPVVKLKGISLMGVPVPNSWMGGMKNIDLVEEFGDEGFWKGFSAGVEMIAIGDGTIEIQLKE